ncbi:MAG: DUF2723 domain-containing protein [Bacteroidetes bacterium]|nr:DUF2723 domain-containing protein [Bacteroidota bacterium]
MNQFRKLNTIAGWVVFAIAAIVYIKTVEPTVSWWDPGEHIATSYKLQIGHPPGAPTFQLAARVLSLFAFGDTSKVALMINMISVLSSAFVILFLFWTITMIAKKLVVPKGKEMTNEKMWTILAAGFIGSMTFTFTDSFWFSAVEANVFAMSYFCTSVVVWAIFKWEEVADEKHHYRWLIFVSFMIGLSIGVHLLNLLTIPALSMVYYFRKYKPTKWGIVIALGISFVLVATLMYFVIPWIPKLASYFELLFVNGFGLPFNSGTIVYFLIFFGLLIWGLWYTRQKGKTVANTILLSLSFLLIGYSAFISLVIRANADTPINENKPKDALTLVSFLNREQYGTWPFLYGQYYTAPVISYADGSPIYKKNTTTGKYEVVDDRKGTIPVYDPRFTTILPRMYCTNQERPGSSEFFKNWGGPGVPMEITGQDGKTETVNKPTFGENLKFMFTYQLNWMYLRYFLWNFSGRQDDVQSFGSIKNGNWITGIPFIDKYHIGNSLSDLPDSVKARASHKYFMLPLILGLIGFFFQLKKDSRNSVIVILLFFMTGLAITLYLNQKPFEPRERDYSYAGSFMAFSIWIGLGVIALVDFLQRKIKLKGLLPVILVTVFSTLLVPVIVAQQNWKDHDRSGKFAARDFAANYLNSCDKNAILVTNGDNDTFPLWYNQEVEGVRTDVRIVNRELASGAWYIEQLYKKMYESDPVAFTIPIEKYQPGTNDIVMFYDVGFQGYVELKDFIDFIRSSDPQTYITVQSGEKVKFFPAKKIKITVNKENCLKYGIVPEYFKDKMVDSITFNIKSNLLYKNDIMTLDMIASSDWKRPIYFAAPNSVRNFLDIEKYCFMEGWIYKFMPVKPDSSNYIPSLGSIDAIGSYNIAMNKCKWGNLNDPKVYVDPESYNNSMRPKMDALFVGQMLLEKGMKKECKALADQYMSQFPDPKFVYDMYNLPFVDMYYKTGDTASAVKLSSRIADVMGQNLDYYGSFSASDKTVFSEDIQTAVEVLNRLKASADQYKQPKLSAKIDVLIKQKNPGI